MGNMIARLLNYILYALGILLAGTGTILKWKIPHGPSGRDISLWGLGKHDWKDLHLWGGIALTVLVLWHLWLHRKWIMSVACKKHSGKLLIGLLAPIALVGAIIVTPLGQLPAGQGGCSGGDCGSCSDKSSCSQQSNACSSPSCGSSKKKDSCGGAKNSGGCSSKAKPSSGCPSEGCSSKNGRTSDESEDQKVIDSCPFTGKQNPLSPPVGNE